MNKGEIVSHFQHLEKGKETFLYQFTTNHKISWNRVKELSKKMDFVLVGNKKYEVVSYMTDPEFREFLAANEVEVQEMNTEKIDLEDLYLKVLEEGGSLVGSFN
ncbi:hypothetical protein [Risungbinella massiliensis]|uniref:hypothetical protein n=1 Tax=Risungbinella massiliensis TaxID=1329796 RepID=UPI000699D891|nr:hypothetical protein [Risungbinella massiliensis]